MDEAMFESPELEALPFEEINDDYPPSPDSSDTSDMVRNPLTCNLKPKAYNSF